MLPSCRRHIEHPHQFEHADNLLAGTVDINSILILICTDRRVSHIPDGLFKTCGQRIAKPYHMNNSATEIWHIPR